MLNREGTNNNQYLRLKVIKKTAKQQKLRHLIWTLHPCLHAMIDELYSKGFPV